MSENVFKSGSSAREKKQAKIEAAVKNELPAAKPKKVHVNFNLYDDSKLKMQKYADENRLTMSALLELWISKNCK